MEGGISTLLANSYCDMKAKFISESARALSI